MNFILNPKCPIYYQNSSVYKLLQLLSTDNVKELRELVKYVIEAI